MKKHLQRLVEAKVLDLSDYEVKIISEALITSLTDELLDRGSLSIKPLFNIKVKEPLLKKDHYLIAEKRKADVWTKPGINVSPAKSLQRQLNEKYGKEQ